MSIQDLGALGELIAAVTTIATLIYLAVQIRDNTRTTRLTATRDLFEQTQRAGLANSKDNEIADIWLIGVRDRSNLSHRDNFRFSQLVFGLFSAWEQQYFHREENLLHRKYFESQIRSYRAAILWPGVRDWWNTNNLWFDENFRTHVDQILESQPAIEPDAYQSERQTNDA